MEKQTIRFSKRLFLFSLLVLCPSLSFGQDTSIVYYDPLNFENVDVLPQFQFNRAGHFLYTGSAKWVIDDTTHVVIGSDFSVNYTTSGVYLHINGITAQKLFPTGVHTLKLTAEFDDSTITKTWYFRFRKIEYKMFNATIVKYQNLSDSKYDYIVIKAEPMDTSGFCCTCTGADTLISYDTNGICHKSKYDVNLNPRIVGDTVNCFVLQQILAPDISDFSLISQPVDSFVTVKKSSPDTLKYPFPLDKAITYFNTYINKNHLEKAYAEISGPLKMGPLMRLQGGYSGDPGWKLSAEFDNKFWYFNHGVGGGDCPCGCTEWKNYSYTISQNEIVSDAVMNPLNTRISKTSVQQKQFSYDLMGRLVRSGHKTAYANGMIIEISNGIKLMKIKIRN